MLTILLIHQQAIHLQNIQGLNSWIGLFVRVGSTISFLEHGDTINTTKRQLGKQEEIKKGWKEKLKSLKLSWQNKNNEIQKAVATKSGKDPLSWAEISGTLNAQICIWLCF